ncbi:MFS transporter [Nonomuraea sp. NPDC049714]|uniref:MFS transporter n=1 Tax=Nonomuraea sp. NPDC049714 TaxID=3364357 RepID=UPI00379C1282
MSLITGRAESATRLWVMAAVLAGAFFLVLFDGLAVSTALPTIGRELGTGPDGLQWVLNVYSLCIGGLLLLGGRACDRWGHRRVLVSALVVLTVATVLAGTAHALPVLLAARALQGGAAAFILPVALAMSGTLFPREPWTSRAFSVILVSGATAGLTGAICGGLLTQALGWRWVFLATVPLALAVLGLAMAVLPRTGRAAARREEFDLVGAVVATASLLALLYGISEAEPVPALLGLAGLGAFAALQSRRRHPLLPLGLLRSPTLIGGCVGIAAHSAVYSAGIVVTSLYLQDVYHLTPAGAGLALAPTLATAMLTGLIAARLVRRHGSARVAGTGLVLAAVSLLGIGLMAGNTSYAVAVLPWLLLRGAAEGVNYVALTRQAISGAARESSGITSGVFEATTHIGGAVAVAAYLTLLAGGAQYQGAYLLGALIAACAAVIVVPLFGQAARPSGAENPGWAGQDVPVERPGEAE